MHSKAQNKQRLYACIVPCLANVWYVSGCNRISRLQPHKWVKITYTSAEIDYYTTNLGFVLLESFHPVRLTGNLAPAKVMSVFVGSRGCVIYEMEILL